jgi:hypothetical protein
MQDACAEQLVSKYIGKEDKQSSNIIRVALHNMGTDLKLGKKVDVDKNIRQPWRLTKSSSNSAAFTYQYIISMG